VAESDTAIHIAAVIKSYYSQTFLERQGKAALGVKNE
jgi:hypothetical protein